MAFTGRLRLALIAAALLPTVLIALIVVVGISEQLKRLENREAAEACRRYADLLDHTVADIAVNLAYIADRRDFQLATWNIQSGNRPDPTYTLPLLSLDFVEYLDTEGVIFLSAARPAMVGRAVDSSMIEYTRTDRHLAYEYDSRGTHPSVAVTMPTENGFLRGGVFFDGVFENLATAVTRASIVHIDLRGPGRRDETISPTGVPFRSEGDLYAVLAFDPAGDFYPLARFEPIETASLFSDFLTAIAAVALFSLLLVIPAGLYFSTRTKRALSSLTVGAGRVASGDFAEPVSVADEGEFSALADSFNRMMKQLDSYRDRLIVSQKIAAWQTIGRRMAHEVKNPLTPITIAVDDLRLSYHQQKDDFDTTLNECTDVIKNQVAHLKKLIGQFSEFAKMPAPEIVTVSAAELIRPISVMFKEECQSGRVGIRNEAGDTNLALDADQMRQVIVNLVKNSLEADCRTCTVTLRRTAGRIEIILEDNGSGFPDRLLTEGITPYFSTKAHGSGLGLIICQRIVYDHDGTLTIQNKPEGGARVDISVPQSDAQDSDNRRRP